MSLQLCKFPLGEWVARASPSSRVGLIGIKDFSILYLLILSCIVLNLHTVFLTVPTFIACWLNYFVCAPYIFCLDICQVCQESSHIILMAELLYLLPETVTCPIPISLALILFSL